jgi:ribosomal protein L32
VTGIDQDHKRQWMPKMEFPRFDGTNVRIWLDKCTAYFQLYGIPSDFRVTVTSLHMIDKASHWFQVYKHSPSYHSWEHFILAISKEFEVNTHRVKTMELLNMKQIGSVEEYKNQFDQLVYHIFLYDHNISETILVSQFLLELRDDLRQDTISQAATLAAVQEHISSKFRNQQKKSFLPKTESKGTFTTIDLWKARQLKEYRRANHLCFKCGEKYTQAHKCASLMPL